LQTELQAEESAAEQRRYALLPHTGTLRFSVAFLSGRKVTGVTMVRTNFKFAQLRDRRRHATPIRRYAWKPRSASPSASHVASRQLNSAFASGEFQSSRHMSPAWILWRSFGLASDIVVLTLASPFFAVWWSWRMIRRLFGAGH
jgi:hypothetical protein